MPPPLSPGDVEALLAAWPAAVCSPTWRLWGESPSPPLFQAVWSNAQQAEVVRDDDGRAVGVIDVREVSESTRTGYLGFLLPPGAPELAGALLAFVQQAIKALGLRTLTVLVDGDVLPVLDGMRSHLQEVGHLPEHTLVTAGRYVDRYAFEVVPS